MTGKRKTRKDKKKEIRPHVEDTYRVWLQRIARRIHTSEGEAGVRLVTLTLHDQDALDFFSDFFLRPYLFNGDTLLNGTLEPKNIEDYIVITGNRDRYKMKFSQDTFEKLDEFKIALGTPYLSHATYALLKYSLHHPGIIKKLDPELDLKEIQHTHQIKPLKRPASSSTSGWSILK